MSFTLDFLQEAQHVLSAGAEHFHVQLEQLAAQLSLLAPGKRLMILGLGGSAAHASHAAADFRKLCHIDAEALTDHTAEWSAWINDRGWENSLSRMMHSRTVCSVDHVLFLSVGGGAPGSGTHGVSMPLVRALEYARDVGAETSGIFGRDGGYLGLRVTLPILIPNLYPEHVTPLVEGITSILLHLLVTHPALARQKPKW